MGRYLWGLDLSIECSAVAIVDLDTLKPVYTVSFPTGHIKNDKNRGKRLRYIVKELRKIYKECPPEIVCIEEAFVRFNNVTKILSEVQGAAKALLGEHEIIYYPVMTWKAAIHHGHATKAKIKQRLLQEYPYLTLGGKDSDEADALGVAMCYLIKNGMIKWDRAIG